MIYKFNTDRIPELSQVGGKAKALIETTKEGLPVPDGIVLSVKFFEPWLGEIKKSKEWENMLRDTRKENCDELEDKALNMNFSKKQKELLEVSLKNLPGDVFAIRSSSPEEDLENTSFAGMYESFLGIKRKNIEESILKAFAFAFSYRVMSYKGERGLDLKNTSIAVIVQKQIRSDISGVGFSLNPLNNSYDEVLINGSFGLGEGIVSGIVTPDTYVVDMIKNKIIDKKINEKRISIKLKEDGGVEEVENENPRDPALSDEEIMELSKLIKICESYYEFPIDIEWAYEKNKLYLLQSRPITSYIPLFPELMTNPEEKKKIYIDLISLTQGFHEPMSVLGLEIWGKMLDRVKGGTMTPDIGGTTPAIHGRQYMSVTDLQKLMGKKIVSNILNSYDGNVKRIFKEIGNIDHLLPDKKPVASEGSKMKFAKLSLGMFPGIVKSIFFNHRTVIEEYEKIANKVIENAKNLEKEIEFHKNIDLVLDDFMTITNSISAMMAGMISQQRIKNMFKNHGVEKEIVALAMDLEGNPTSEMGHLLFKMASNREFKNISSRKDFIQKAENRSFDKVFLKDYDEFMDKYAVRGFMEIDVASKRIYEDIGLLYDKLIEIDTEDNQISKVKEKRELAYNKLLELAKSKGKENKFIKLVEKYQETFGYREHPKYVIVYIFAQLHNICLEIGEDWVEERLDDPYDIFDLHVEEIERAQKDKNLDLRQLRKINLEPYKKVEHIKNWPLVIDSRGKIYKPKMDIKDGDIIGDPIAPGKVIGRAKVLETPYEKPIRPGDILVTRATEPSWTPIFTNASGVIMEIGGPLQHGGIIAREYGIPCVSGLIGIMDMIKDGDLVEVDGDNGIVRIIEEK